MTSTQDEKREKALQDVKLYMASGWEIKEETPHSFVLTRRTNSTGLHIIIFLLTCGLGNIVYYLLAKESKVILK